VTVEAADRLVDYLFRDLNLEFETAERAFEALGTSLTLIVDEEVTCLHHILSDYAFAIFSHYLPKPVKYSALAAPPSAPPSATLLKKVQSLITARVLTGSDFDNSSNWKPKVTNLLHSFHSSFMESVDRRVINPSFAAPHRQYFASLTNPISLVSQFQSMRAQDANARQPYAPMHRAIFVPLYIDRKREEGMQCLRRENPLNGDPEAMKREKKAAANKKKKEKKKQKEKELDEIRTRCAEIELLD
jgi:hypothetical protein